MRLNLPIKFSQYAAAGLLCLTLPLVGCQNQKKSATSDTQEAPVEVAVTAAPQTKTSVVNSQRFYSAALANDVATVEKCITEGMDVNQRDMDERTAMMYAAFNGNVEVMQLLKKHGADVHALDPGGRSLLMIAATCPSSKGLRWLLDQGIAIDLGDTKDNFTALMYAAAEGQLSNVKLLIEHKANPNLLTTENHSAWFFAKNNSHFEVASYLQKYTKTAMQK